MIFALTTDDRSLHSFANESEVCGYAEGIDVEDGVWLFFDDNGNPLVPIFTKPNERGCLSVLSGSYRLISSALADKRHLLDLLPEVSAVDGELCSVEAVRRHLSPG